MQKPYSQLSRAGRVRRLHNLAVKALGEYDLRVKSLEYHCFDTNLLYRVLTNDGDRYILRLAVPGWRTLDDLLAEASWLDALRQDTDITVPRILRSQRGDRVLQLRGAGIPDVWNATLMSYLPGRLLGKYLTENNIEKMGVLFAKLHIHGKEWSLPPDFSKRVFDGFLSRGEPDVLFDPEQLEGYSQYQLALTRRVHGLVAREYSLLDREDLRVIHCDLWHDNIKLHRGVLCPFDFEDTVRGFRLHDIAMAMLDLLEDTDNYRYPQLLAAFRRGYETLIEWPPGKIEALQAGRLLWKINYVARFERTWMPQMVKRHEPILNHFVKTGEIRLFAL
ncbi:MAG: phosphotransferase [Spirochaetales bacterium]|nr:phosphotransferase [Spirochaetales bacterium]